MSPLLVLLESVSEFCVALPHVALTEWARSPDAVVVADAVATWWGCCSRTASV